MKKHIALNLFVLFLSNVLIAQTPLPAGVKGAKIWLTTNSEAANEIKLENRLSSSQLPISQDQSASETINYNPSFWLDANKKKVVSDLENIKLNQATIFTVYQTRGKEKILWHLKEEENTKTVLTTHRFSDLSNYEYLNFKTVTPNVPVINTYFHHSGNKETTSKQLHIGTLPTDQDLPIESFNGLLPEIVVFDRVLNPTERLKVESYLAIKYGTTINNETNEQLYLNTDGDTLWHTKLHQAKFHRITGIGRDDVSGLNQLKSTNSYNPHFLTIGVTPPKNSNNPFPNQTYLLWGDNDASLTFAKPNLFQAKLLNRHWRMQVKGATSNIPTTLALNPKSLHIQPKATEAFWLVVDDSGGGAFDVNKLQYYPASNSSTKEKVVFKDIKWDTDNSGIDNFTLAIGPKVLTKLSPEELANLHAEPEIENEGIPQFDVYPNPSTDGYFQVKIRPNELDQITLKIHNALGQEITQQSFSGSDYYFYENQLAAKGIYVLSIVEAGKVFTRKLVVEHSK